MEKIKHNILNIIYRLKSNKNTLKEKKNQMENDKKIKCLKKKKVFHSIKIKYINRKYKIKTLF